MHTSPRTYILSILLVLSVFIPLFTFASNNISDTDLPVLTAYLTAQGYTNTNIEEALTAFQIDHAEHILGGVGILNGVGTLNLLTRQYIGMGEVLGASTDALTLDLTIGSKNEDVRRLQQFLNTHGFPIATTGDGSLGLETTFYGPGTMSAVKRFQEAYAGDILTPNNLTKGSGHFFASTRAFVNKQLQSQTTTGTHSGHTTPTVTGTNKTLTINVSGTGSVSANGQTCSTSRCVFVFPNKTKVKLTATNADSTTFKRWSETCRGTKTTCTVTLTKNKKVTSSFIKTTSGDTKPRPSTSGGGGGGSSTPKPTPTTTPTVSSYTLTTSISGQGTITATNINCGTDCTESYVSGTLVTLTQTPKSGYTFAGWSGSCTGTGSCSVSMTQARSVTASFTVTPTPTETTWKTVAQEWGSFTLPASTRTRYGAQSKWAYRTLTGTVYCNNTTYGDPIPTVVKSCQIPSTANTTTPTPVTPPSSATTYTITTTLSGSGAISSNPAGITCGTDCSQAYNSGTAVTLMATPATGYTFTGWSGSCTGTGSCSVSMTQARSVTATFSVVATTPTPPVAGMGFMPYVDTSKNMVPAVGFDTLRVKPTTQLPASGKQGAFRIVCTPSHMSNDDPIVYPGQQGRAHHHTFYGNTSIDYKTDVSNIDAIGNSTCKGGLMNRSAYWVPTMIDTKTNAPVIPKDAIFYYKNNRMPDDVKLTAPPKGLRIIAGNMHAKTAGESRATYTCLPPSGSDELMTGWHKNVQICKVGWEMEMSVSFPSCWDGINLDSPDHQSHMAYNIKVSGVNKCPTTHPVAIPHITLNLNYLIGATTDASTWRLSSDNYSRDLPAGYSSHADWINGWNPTFLQGFVDNCLNKNLDCFAHLLGDGRSFN